MAHIVFAVAGVWLARSGLLRGRVTVAHVEANPDSTY